MSFLAPIMFWGAVAGGIPIALHFFFRSRYRIVPWAAMEFLLTSIQQTSRRLKFQELLLLLLRVALLLLLVFALSRPTFSLGGAFGRGEAIDAVLVFDNSASMGAREGGKTRLDWARGAALELLEGLPSSSTVQIITCSDRAAYRGPRVPADLGLAREEIEKLKPSDLATDFTPGFDETLAALNRGTSANREVYFFSDMQRIGWKQQAQAARSRIEEIRRRPAHLTLVRCGTQTPRNAAVLDILPQSGIPHKGERASFAVLVRNTSKQPIANLSVTLEVDGREKDRETQIVSVVPAGEMRIVMINAELKRSGPQVIKAFLSADDLDNDNQLERILNVRDQVRIIIVDGNPNPADFRLAGSFHLKQALQPVVESALPNYHIQVSIVSPRQAQPSMLSNADLCILADTAIRTAEIPGDRSERHLRLEFLERLAEFVRLGRGLLIFVGPNVLADDYNKLLGEKLGLLPLKLGKVWTAPMTRAVHPDPATASPYSFLASFREKPLDGIRFVDVLKGMEGTFFPNESTTQVLLKWTDGNPALALRPVGRGQVLLCTTSADCPDRPEDLWTFWPKWPTFLPLVHACLGQVIQAPAQGLNRRAGEALVWHPPIYDANRSHVANRLGEKNKILESWPLGLPRLENRESVVRFSDTLWSGVYQIKPESSDPEEEKKITSLDPEPRNRLAGGLFAVAMDTRETEDLETLSNREIDEILGYEASHVDLGPNNASLTGERLGQEWTWWLLWGVVLVLLGEGALAWFCGRSW